MFCSFFSFLFCFWLLFWSFCSFLFLNLFFSYSGWFQILGFVFFSLNQLSKVFKRFVFLLLLYFFRLLWFLILKTIELFAIWVFISVHSFLFMIFQTAFWASRSIYLCFGLFENRSERSSRSKQVWCFTYRRLVCSWSIEGSPHGGGLRRRIFFLLRGVARKCSPHV